MLTGAIGLAIKAFALLAFIANVVLRLLKRRLDTTDESYEPTVEVVIPMYNEGAGIEETLTSLLAQEYPAAKLRITVVDDCSTDDSFERVQKAARFARERLRALRNPENVGKRHSIIRAVRESSAEIIVSVDSDCVVEPNAIRELVRRFSEPRIAAVGGRVDVRNKHVNWLTRMQTVKYWYNYHAGKTVEQLFRQVMCLSGCLTAYRRHVLLQIEPVLVNRNLLGVPIKYGEDRFLTRQIVKAGYLTTMTNRAVCSTVAPTTVSGFFAQQLRWRRSGIVDYGGLVGQFHRLNPLLSLHFICIFALLIAYPALLVKSAMAGTFFPLMVRKMLMCVVLGVVYRLLTRKLSPEQRVSVLSFVPFALLAPIIYGLLMPLALFTLDSSSWETRRHPGARSAGAGAGGDGGGGRADEVPVAAAVPVPVPAAVAPSLPVVAAAEAALTTTGSHRIRPRVP